MSHFLTPFLTPVQLWENVCLFSPHCTAAHFASNWILWFQSAFYDKLISRELRTCLAVLNLCEFYFWENLSDTMYGNNSCTEVNLKESVHNLVFSVSPVELLWTFLDMMCVCELQGAISNTLNVVTGYKYGEWLCWYNNCSALSWNKWSPQTHGELEQWSALLCLPSDEIAWV
jgi:hypothetical protein